MSAGSRPALGVWDATSVVIGAIIGVGIFFSPRDVARLAGGAEAALLAWAIGGVIALLGAFTFAELGRLQPRSGGQYHVLRDAYGRAPAFLFVFCNLTAVQAGAVAIIAIICAQNLGVALKGHDPSASWVTIVALALLWALTGLNVLGVRPGARVQSGTVVLKLVTLAALVALAAFLPSAGAGPSFAPAATTFGSLFAGVTITLFAYGGWQQVLWMADEVADAHRVVPHAIVLGVAVVICAYLAANWAFLDLLGFAGTREAKSLVGDAFAAAWPGAGGRIAAAAVFVSAFGVLNAQFLTGPRLTWAMARDGQFFAPFARLDPRFLTPVPAILLLAGIATALLLGLGLDRTDLLTTGVVVIDATFFALTGLALPLLRRRVPKQERGPAWVAWAALAFAALELLAIAGSVMSKDVRLVALTGLAWIGVAGITWLGFFRKAR